MEKNEESKAVEIGTRMKNRRMALGYSRETLAKMANTSQQNIWKYENKGLSNIDDITNFGRLLKIDLTKDEKFVEGDVGEVGLEILISLIKAHGYIGFNQLLDNVYGMDRVDMTKEVTRLATTGLCKRNQYTDFDGLEKDAVCLTAKGLITAKHKISNPLIIKEIEEDIDKVKTFEEQMKDDWQSRYGDATDYQDYVDKRKLEKKVRALKFPHSLRRADYIFWLKQHYMHEIGYEKFQRIKNGHLLGTYGIRSTVYRYMMGGVTRENICRILDSKYESDTRSYIDEVNNPAKKTDIPDLFDATIKRGKNRTERFLGKLSKVIDENSSPEGKYCMPEDWWDEREYPWLGLEICNYEAENDWVPEGMDPDEYHEIIEESNCEWQCEQHDFWHTYSIMDVCEKNYYERKDKTNVRPTIQNLYGIDEVEAYVKANILPPKNKDEIALDKALLEINRKWPETLSYYYYPEAWKEAGIDKYIDGVYGIDSIRKSK